MPDNHLKKLEKTIILVHGETGRQWWRNLPRLLDNLESTQGFSLLAPFEHLTYNYVLPVLSAKGEDWVLKLNVPHVEFSREIYALKYFNGRGAVRLIDANPEQGWMLMERLFPGGCLVDLSDQRQAIPIAVDVMQRLWMPINDFEHFVVLEQWLRSLELLNTQKSLRHLVRKPLRDFVFDRAKELLSSQGEQVLLHGDFQHYNILQRQSEWCAIDPKGVIGEREFEISAFLRNPASVVEVPLEAKELKRRLDYIIELTAFNRERVLSWCIIQAILCVCWYAEDKMLEQAEQLIAYAERLYSLI